MTGNGFFSIPEHTPLIFTECSGTGRTLFRLLVSDACGENEGYLLAETVPYWAVDVTVKVWKSTLQAGANRLLSRLQNSRVFCERKLCDKYSNERFGASVETARENALRACEARALHTRGSRLRRFAPSENGRKRLFCSLVVEKLWCCVCGE